MSSPDALERLDVFVGEWDMASSLAPDPDSAPRARTTFEWLSGRRFLVQRWEVDLPEAPTASRSSDSTRRRTASSSTTSTPAASRGSTR